MSDLSRYCPGCEGHTSAIGQAFRDGEPCPYCGLPADVAEMVEAARERHADNALTERLIEAEKQLAIAQRELTELRAKVGAASAALR